MPGAGVALPLAVLAFAEDVVVVVVAVGEEAVVAEAAVVVAEVSLER